MADFHAGNQAMPKHAVIVFAHGARDPAWAEPLKRICEALRQRRPGLRVELAFLELMTPAIGDALDALAAEGILSVTVVPAFMARGGHLKKDLPLLIEAAQGRNPGLAVTVVPAMGESELVIGAIADYAAGCANRGTAG